MEKSYLILGTLSTSRSITLEVRTSVAFLMIKKFVYSNNIFYLWIEDRLHLNNCSSMFAFARILSIVTLTGVNTTRIPKVRHLRGAPVRHPRGAQVRHPRGALVRHSWGARVRHPRGANVRHPRGALIIEDRQDRSSVSYHVRHPSGAFIEEDLQASSSVYYRVRHQVVHL